MSLEKARVKEEEEWENEAEESETAERAGMYAELETKLEIDPETIEQSNVTPANRDNPLNIEAIDGCSKDALAKCYVKLERILTEIIHKCEICGMRFDSISSFQTHMHSHEAIGVKTECYECDMCNKSLKKRSNLIEHIKCKQKSHSCATCRRHSSCESKFRAQEQMCNVKHTFSCKICERIFKADRKLFRCEGSRGGYIYHCKICKQEFSKHNSTFICDICKKVLTSKKTLKVHLRIHTAEKPYCRNMCKKRFATTSALICHGPVHIYSCGICNKHFSTKYSLNYHIRFHTGEELFTCNICNRRFLLKSQLIGHVHTHTRQSIHHCDVCGRQFTPKDNMLTHQRTHIREEPFSCKTCHKQFQQKGALRTHERLVKGPEPHACVQCNKHFCYEKSSRAHQMFCLKNSSESCGLSDSAMEKPRAQIIPENIETEIKKEMAEDVESEPQKTVINTYKRSTVAAMFSCDICKKQFTKQSSLTQHLQILHSTEKSIHGHMTEKRFSCKICHKQFKKADALRAHERLLKGPEPYVCVICNKHFCYKRALRTHQMFHIYSSELCELSDSDMEKPRAQIIPENIEEIEKEMAEDGESEPQKTVINTYKRSTAAAMFSCDICKKQFTKKSNLKQHLQILHPIEKSIHGRVHMREKPYSCDICDKRFTFNYSLNNHKRIHTREERFSCKMCHKQFKKATALRAHERLVKGPEPYVCVICHKHFCYKRALRAHQMSHIYSSELCELSDSNMEKSRTQIIPENIETEIKKEMAEDVESEPQKTVINTYKRSTVAAMFSCDICKKQFTRQSSLSQHVQILHPIEKSIHGHTREKRFSCKMCHKQFKKAGALRNHESAVKARQPYVCVICNKHFCYKRSLNAHKIIHRKSSKLCKLSDSDMEKQLAQIKQENIEEIKKEMAGDGESEPQKTVINTYKRSTAAAMFSCDICKKQFTKQSSLTQHVQILHPIEKSFMSTQ